MRSGVLALVLGVEVLGRGQLAPVPSEALGIEGGDNCAGWEVPVQRDVEAEADVVVRVHRGMVGERLGSGNGEVQRGTGTVECSHEVRGESARAEARAHAGIDRVRCMASEFRRADAVEAQARAAGTPVPLDSPPQSSNQ